MNPSFSPSSLVSRIHFRMHKDPVRDWLILLTLSFLALAVIVVWNIWAFQKVARGEAIAPAGADAASSFNRSSIDAIHTVFESRAAEEAKYEMGVYRYADPSQ